ncbi:MULTISPECIES: (R)-1-hydroxy-2-aminoethylphosphonate ammonia-lyase [Cytobacillus]|uniref:Aspartate aminotransferase family protein n=1 Tax=Cytobacillus kochii TaxID=859143 RepID=A0A248TN26_9BACI|nr:aspartate aminotransferase family protein [Cytobacillus kochii]ASV69616.1 aspartate aminotransferase family protein [Cytobacillus kochii]
MKNKEALHREGDVNNSPSRMRWNHSLDQVSRETLWRDEAVFIRQSMSTPCLQTIVDADGCYLIDREGKRYLDFHGNSLHQVGYKNPYVIEAITKQMNTLPFIPRRFTADIAMEAGERLIEKTISKDFKVLFVPSGSAAVGLAMKIARKVTGNHKVISMWESFHGAGLDAISAGGESVFKNGIGPMLPGMIKVMPYQSYRNVFGASSPEDIAEKSLNYLEYVIINEGNISCILLEPIRATDTHIPPRSYFKRLRKICDEHGILLIFDEIPTAFYRSGECYVHQLYDIEPDILVLGKGLGGGIVPQAAVLVKKVLDTAAEVSLGHYTHEKPAIGSAAIVAMLNYIDDYRLKENSLSQSQFMAAKLKKLAEQYTCIGDLRICGLLITIELVKSRDTKEKDEQLTEFLLYYCLQHGLSFKVAAGNCITWHPPLIIKEKEASLAIELLENGLRAYHA